MFRGCAPRASLVQRALRPSIQNTFPRLRSTTSFSSSALRAQQYPPEQPEEQPTATRFPLSVQAIYYKPLHRTPVYGLPVCDLQFRSYSVRQLEAQCDFALRAAYYLNMPASGVVPLPKKIERWTVPRSNFVHKKSQENYERITYKRLIQIKDANPEVIELWLAFIKKHAVYGVGMKANVWAFEEVGVGKQMNVSLANLHDVKRPRWAHFGPRKTVETAAMVREILESEKYKAPEFKTTEAVRPDAIDQQPVVLAQGGRRASGIKKIEEDMTCEELRFRELEMEVAQTHGKDYLKQATEGQRVAEEKLAETRQALKSEPQKAAAQKPEPAVMEPEPTPAKAEQQRSEVDIIRDLELKKALEAKEAAEAKAAEESRKTAELQAQLLAQVAAIQAELAALRAEKANSAAPAPAPTPTPAPPVETKVEVEAAPSTEVEKQAEAVAAEEVAVPEPAATETPITESIPAHTTNEPAEELTAAPESPVIDAAAAESAAEQLTQQAETDTTEAAPVESAPAEASPAQTAPETIPAHPADQPADALTTALETPANDSGAAEVIAESQPASTEAAPEPVEVVAEKAMEDTPPAAVAEEVEPVPYEATEVIAEPAEIVESPETIVEAVATVESLEEPIKAEESAPIQQPAAPEGPAIASESQAESESVAEAQPKRQEEQPEVQIANEESVTDELPASSETTETPDVVKRQPEVTRDEEPEPERHEKPEETKDEEQPR